VKGVSLPGSPNVIIGFNENIAWSVTNALRDVVDWYKIAYTDESREAYLLDNESKPTEFRVEEIKLKGKEPYYDTVAITHWGPVMYDDSYPTKSGDGAYALRWIAHDVYYSGYVDENGFWGHWKHFGIGEGFHIWPKKSNQSNAKEEKQEIKEKVTVKVTRSNPYRNY